MWLSPRTPGQLSARNLVAVRPVLPALVLCCGLACWPGLAQALDLSVGFGGESRLYLEARLPEPGNAGQGAEITGGRAESLGRLSLEGGYASLSAELFIGLNRGGGRPVLRLDELAATLYPSDRLVFRLGSFRFDDTQALILPSADYLSPQVPEALLSGSPRTSLPENLAQASLLLGPLSFRGTLGLTAPPSVVPELDSPWFPFGMFPETLASDILSRTFTRTQILVQEASASPLSWEPAYLASLQYEGESLSAGLRAFRGLERAEVWQGYPYFPNGPFSSIVEFHLAPHSNPVTAFGGALVYTRNNWRWFAEGGYTLGRSADSRELDENNDDMDSWYFKIHAIDEATASAGLLWSSVGLPLRVAAELKWSEYTGIKDSTILPALGKAAALACAWQPLSALSLDLLYLRSLSDDSAALTARARFSFGNDHEAVLMIPWLRGKPDSELGRYDNGLYGTAALVLRY